MFNKLNSVISGFWVDIEYDRDAHPTFLHWEKPVNNVGAGCVDHMLQCHKIKLYISIKR